MVVPTSGDVDACPPVHRETSELEYARIARERVERRVSPGIAA
jgi:hypothetical protein